MASLKELNVFLIDSIKGLKVAKYGKTNSDKFNLLYWYIFLSRNPDLLRKKMPQISNAIQYLSSIVCSRTVCLVDNISFTLVEMSDIYILYNSFESFLYKYLDAKEGDVFIDVGSHIGKYSLKLAKKVGNNGIVIAIEANPQNYYTLIKNIHDNNCSNVKAYNLAAWNTSSYLEMFPGKYSTLNSLKKCLQEQQGYDSNKPSQKVKADCLDNILQDCRKITLIKIDVEGAEIEALQGLRKTLDRNSPELIVECWEQSREKLNTLMASYGYTAESISSTYIYFYKKNDS
jgi:FkbM family methyltransferase